MKLENSDFLDVSVLRISGRLDHETTPGLEQKVEQHVNICVERKSNLVIDLGDVAYVSSIALRCIFRVSKTLSAVGGRLVLTSMQPVVREIFSISGLDSRISIMESPEKAIGELSADALAAYHATGY